MVGLHNNADMNDTCLLYNITFFLAIASDVIELNNKFIMHVL